LAPGANIIVLGPNTGRDGDLGAAVKTAKAMTNVSVISNSYVRPEANTDQFDQFYKTPAGHGGITFVAAAGDSGEVEYPSNLPTVVGVGGTSLTLNTDNTYQAESVWNNST